MKLLVSDYDHTFYLNEKDILENVDAVKCFREENLFAIATGRSLLDFCKMRDQYSIEYDYLIVNHGATVYKNDEVIFHAVIDEDVKCKIIEIVNGFYDDVFCCTLTNSRADLMDQKLTKIHLDFSDFKLAIKVKSEIEKTLSDHVHCYFVSGGNAIEIVSGRIDKSTAVEFLSSYTKVLLDDIYTVGDSYTDITMLENYHGFAMEDSVTELKEFPKVKSVSNLIYQLLDKGVVIAIDGKSTTGKSTIAKLLAKRLGYQYLNTGAVYRMIALKMKRENISIQDEFALSKLLGEIRLDIVGDEFYLDLENVTKEIYTQEIALLSTSYASCKLLKDFIREYQKKYSLGKKIVVEGRDIGTVVFPEADFKFYLLSSLEVRARRLFCMRKLEENVSYEQVLEELSFKDEVDEKEENFVLPEDAIRIDTSHLEIEEVLDIMMNYIEKR